MGFGQLYVADGGICQGGSRAGAARAGGSGGLMSRGPQTFRQSDVTKALKAVMAAGQKWARVEIEVGKIVVIAGKQEHHSGTAAELDRELAEFEARHGAG